MDIGIDVDGVLRDIHSKLVQVYDREMGKKDWSTPVDKWYQYDVAPFFSIGDQIYDFWFNSHAEEIYLHSLPFPDVVSTLKMLKILGHKIHIITSQPNQKTTEYTLRWLYDFNIPFDGIHITPDKHLVDCGVYIDDAPNFIDQIHGHGSGSIVVRKHGWNREYHALFDCVDSMTEFGEHVRSLL